MSATHDRSRTIFEDSHRWHAALAPTWRDRWSVSGVMVAPNGFNALRKSRAHCTLDALSNGDYKLADAWTEEL